MAAEIPLSDETLRRVDQAARLLGLSRSEFFARAVERWLVELDEAATTAAINRAIAGIGPDHAFTNAAAADLVARD